MAVKPQIKANQLAKDLNLKSKDIVDIMAEKGVELKAQKTLEPHEFDMIFDALTAANQIEGIDDYIDGVTFIPSKLEKTEKAESVEEKVSVSEEKTEAPKETKAPETAKAEKTEQTKTEKDIKPQKVEKTEKTEKAEANSANNRPEDKNNKKNDA